MKEWPPADFGFSAFSTGKPETWPLVALRLHVQRRGVALILTYKIGGALFDLWVKIDRPTMEISWADLFSAQKSMRPLGGCMRVACAVRWLHVACICNLLFENRLYAKFCVSKSKQNHHVAHATEVQPGGMSLVFLWKMSKIAPALPKPYPDLAPNLAPSVVSQRCPQRCPPRIRISPREFE